MALKEDHRWYSMKIEDDTWHRLKVKGRKNSLGEWEFRERKSVLQGE